ncbi:hypothetical protein HMPREF1544_10116 [Mucor circinelloides 1006PhL]|uniref:Uncharacterized protein n=1 Tax=Mucor circinelloides f. circinelloides (strain 1006PhL) TaxID=1220926 RepID=S2IZD1_MUCC1|nr:hypothetical protein HMPREF1544_10116 [Mucor circinelloides 1006PhL]
MTIHSRSVSSAITLKLVFVLFAWSQKLCFYCQLVAHACVKLLQLSCVNTSSDDVLRVVFLSGALVHQKYPDLSLAISKRIIGIDHQDSGNRKLTVKTNRHL